VDWFHFRPAVLLCLPFISCIFYVNVLCQSDTKFNNVSCCKGKGKGRLPTATADTDRQWTCSSTHPQPFVTNWIAQSVHGGRQLGEVGSRRTSRLTKNICHMYRWVGPMAGLRQVYRTENTLPTAVQDSDRPARSTSQYRMRYRRLDCWYCRNVCESSHNIAHGCADRQVTYICAS
jgi:hypothetical protein